MERKLAKVGNVVLDYSDYSGKDLYTDGEIEEILLEASKSGTEDELLLNSMDWPILYHFSDIRENLLEWMPISSNDEILEIGSGCGAITSVLSKKTAKVTCVELSEKRSLINANRHKDRNNIEIKIGNFQDIEPKLGKYDYITLIGVLEYAKMYIEGSNPYVQMLKIAKKHLKENGHLVIAIENKVGLKYWNGACEDHTGLMYSGLNDYIGNDYIRTFSANELKNILEESGFDSMNLYCTLPDYKLPNIITSYDYKLKPGNVRTYRKNYSKARFYNFMEDVASDQLCADGMYSYMANSYLVVTGKQKEKLVFTKFCNERKKEYRIVTGIISNDNGISVIKRPLCPEATEHILSLKEKENMCCGSLPSLECVSGMIVDGEYVSEYIEGDTIEEKMYSCRNDVEKFINMTQRYVDDFLTPQSDILHPFVMSEEFAKVFGDVDCNGEACMRVTNIDAIFSNIKIDKHGKAWVFDFEWVFDFDIPYKYTIWRACMNLYNRYLAYLKNSINSADYINKLGFSEDEHIRYKKMENHFGEYVFGKSFCEIYTKRYIKPAIMQQLNII